MTDDTPTPEDIDELAELIEQADAAWTVDDWAFKTGKYDTSVLDLSLEWSPPEPVALDIDEIQDLKTLIAKIESEHVEGAPLNTIFDTAHERFGWEAARVSEELDKLRTKGEVYEPKPDHLRTT